MAKSTIYKKVCTLPILGIVCRTKGQKMFEGSETLYMIFHGLGEIILGKSAEMCTEKCLLMPMWSWAEGLACADPTISPSGRKVTSEREKKTVLIMDTKCLHSSGLPWMLNHTDHTVSGLFLFTFQAPIFVSWISWYWNFLFNALANKFSYSRGLSTIAPGTLSSSHSSRCCCVSASTSHSVLALKVFPDI